VKSLIVALPLIAGATWAGTSYFAGAQSEAGYDQFLSQTNAANFLTFEKESFEQGLTTSKAVTVVKESSAPDAEVLFRLAHDINHSSVQLNDNSPSVGTATIRTTLVDGSINSRYDNIHSFFTGDEPIEIITRAGVAGHVASEITLGALTLTSGEKETATVEETKITLTNDADRIVGDGAIGAVVINSTDGSSATISASIVSFDLATEQMQTSDSHLSVKTDEITAQTPYQNTPITANGLQLSFNSDVEGDQIDYLASINIDAIDTGSTPTIDTAPVTSGSLEIATNNFKIQAIRDYYGFLEGVDGNNFESFSSEYLHEFVKLATKNIELVMNLDLNNSAGNANATFNIAFIGDQSASGRDTIVTGKDLANAIKVEADVVADKAALALTPAVAMMQSPPAQFAFEDQGDQWVSRLRATGLTAQINNEIIQLGDLTGGLLELPLEEIREITGY